MTPKLGAIVLERVNNGHELLATIICEHQMWLLVAVNRQVLWSIDDLMFLLQHALWTWVMQ